MSENNKDNTKTTQGQHRDNKNKNKNKNNSSSVRCNARRYALLVQDGSLSCIVQANDNDLLLW